MGRKGTVDITAAGWDPRQPTQRELLALSRMEDPDAHGSPGVQDFVCVENLFDRCHGKGCFLALDGELRDEAACPGFCFTRDAAWRTWGLL
jgi:hypothetical protein